MGYRVGQVTRRDFIRGAGTTLAAWPVLAGVARAQATDGRRVFLHGVASGDPLADRVVLWTRVTPVSDYGDLARQRPLADCR